MKVEKKEVAADHIVRINSHYLVQVKLYCYALSPNNNVLSMYNIIIMWPHFIP